MNNRKVLKKYFKEFINILDTKSDYYILNYYINEVKNEQTNKDDTKKADKEDGGENNKEESKSTESVVNLATVLNTASIFVAKNADHILLPLPRENPDII